MSKRKNEQTEPAPMEVLALYNGKGGVGKSTLTPICAAAIKKLFPQLSVGVIAADTDQRSLAWSYSPDLENDDKGIWAVIASKVDKRTATNEEHQVTALKEGVRKLRVVPNVSSEDGCIDFMSCAGELGKQWSQVPPLGQPNSYITLGKPLLDLISDRLGWDLCLLDLPGSIKDPLVMALLPCCTSVVIVSDCLKIENLSMEEQIVHQLREVQVTVKGFLANKVNRNSKSSLDAVAGLEAIADYTGIPLIAQVRALDTLLTSNRAHSVEGEPILATTEKWELPEGGLHVGLYRITEGTGRNRSNPSVVKNARIAALELEHVALALLEECFPDSPNFRRKLKASKDDLKARKEGLSL